MIWYLIICGLDPDKSDCTFSPPLKSQQQCQFISQQISDMEMRKRRKKCVGVKQ